jgi:hypothetical protein
MDHAIRKAESKLAELEAKLKGTKNET